jgi:hypothetical protein
VDQKEQIIRLFLQITDLKTQLAEHWAMADRATKESRVDDTITLLNAYFRLKTKIEVVEGNLQGILNGYYASQ